MPLHIERTWPVVQGLTLEQIICLGRCGSAEQFWGMARAFFDQKCPFCDHGYLSGEIIKEGEYWFILQPPGEYNRNAKKLARKLVLVPKGHHRNLDGLAIGAWRELPQFFAALKMGKDEGGMLYLRTGSALFNAATVPGHIHWNYDVPSGNDEVRPPIYKDASGWTADLERFRTFYGEYERGIPLEDYLRRFK